MLHSIQEEQLPSSEPVDICNYWPANPAFDPKRVLHRRMFFINEDKTKYMSVGFYLARDYQPLVEFGAIRREGSKSLILTQQKSRGAGGLTAIRDSMCVGGDRIIIKCESGNFRLHTPKRHDSDRLFVGTELDKRKKERRVDKWIWAAVRWEMEKRRLNGRRCSWPLSAEFVKDCTTKKEDDELC